MKEQISRQQFKKFFRDKPGWVIRSFFSTYIVVVFGLLFPIPLIAAMFSSESAASIYRDAFKQLKRIITAEFV